VITHNSEWLLAALGCRALHKDAHLLVINNAQEHFAVAAMLASVNRQYSIFDGQAYAWPISVFT